MLVKNRAVFNSAEGGGVVGVFTRTGRKPAIKMGKSSAEERFTVLLVSSRGRSRTLGFGLQTVKVLRWIGLALVVAISGLIIAYRVAVKELAELRYMHEVAETHREQIHSLQDQFSEIRERLRETELVEARIQDILRNEGMLSHSYASGAGLPLTASRIGPIVTSRDLQTSRFARVDDMGRSLAVLLDSGSRLEDSLSGKLAKAEALLEEAEETVLRLRATPSIWPVMGEITSDFGWRVNPFNNYSREYHEGIDIGAYWWEPIQVAADGRVTFADYKYGYGWTVVVEHDYGYQTVYAHCCYLEVDSGDCVSRGDIVGYVGESGSATGPHLHYEVRLWGTPSDPRQFLP